MQGWINPYLTSQRFPNEPHAQPSLSAAIHNKISNEPLIRLGMTAELFSISPGYTMADLMKENLFIAKLFIEPFIEPFFPVEKHIMLLSLSLWPSGGGQFDLISSLLIFTQRLDGQIPKIIF